MAVVQYRIVILRDCLIRVKANCQLYDWATCQLFQCLPYTILPKLVRLSYGVSHLVRPSRMVPPHGHLGELQRDM
ncbi:uncharacterized protein BDV17DRAFT_259379 [Aspergillus undulatus]|uniref:uncharacterized protein n=1 Tax=Aspergillus undulatus TaxID=1810928 RepID=UPI003CCCB993